MTLWSEETKKIITSNSVTEKTYTEKVGKVGFETYVKGLGGVFKKCYGDSSKISTVQDLHERMEYVMGLMYIFKMCYWNGSTWWYWMNSASKAFYSRKVTNKGCRGGTISQLCQGTDGRLRITCCNYGIDTLLRQCGMYSLKKATVTDKSKLVPGDVIDLYRNGKWHHQVMVHSISDGKIWCADFGNRFIKTGVPLHYMSLSGKTAGGEYGSDAWKGRHRLTLKTEEPKIKTTAEKAVELIRDIENYISKKEQEYGNEVTLEAKMLISDKQDYLRACADYVLDGYAGSGETRERFFGDDYDDMQKMVTWVINTAKDVVKGKYGNGEDRKKALGDNWQVVQNEVERMKERGEF